MSADFFVISRQAAHSTAMPFGLSMLHASNGDYGYGLCSPQTASHPIVSAISLEEVVRQALLVGYRVAVEVPADVQAAVVGLKDMGHDITPVLVRMRGERDFEVRIVGGDVQVFEADALHSSPGQYAGWVKANNPDEARSLARRSDFVAGILEDWLNQE